MSDMPSHTKDAHLKQRQPLIQHPEGHRHWLRLLLCITAVILRLLGPPQLQGLDELLAGACSHIAQQLVGVVRGPVAASLCWCISFCCLPGLFICVCCCLATLTLCCCRDSTRVGTCSTLSGRGGVCTVAMLLKPLKGLTSTCAFQLASRHALQSPCWACAGAVSTTQTGSMRGVPAACDSSSVSTSASGSSGAVQSGCSSSTMDATYTAAQQQA